jgi:hypothetical protein
MSRPGWKAWNFGREGNQVTLAVMATSGLSAVAQRAKAEAAKQSVLCLCVWIASRSLSSGAK